LIGAFAFGNMVRHLLAVGAFVLGNTSVIIRRTVAFKATPASPSEEPSLSMPPPPPPVSRSA